MKKTRVKSSWNDKIKFGHKEFEKHKGIGMNHDKECIKHIGKEVKSENNECRKCLKNAKNIPR